MGDCAARPIDLNTQRKGRQSRAELRGYLPKPSNSKCVGWRLTRCGYYRAQDISEYFSAEAGFAEADLEVFIDAKWLQRTALQGPR